MHIVNNSDPKLLLDNDKTVQKAESGLGGLGTILIIDFY
jgi:hypothetical protein